jgi:protein gp37
MGSKTGIAWTDATWNPWQGCAKVSEGCRNCYMYREKTRYGQDPMTVVLSKPATFNAPLKWARTGELPEGSRIFVCSWSDFFHEDADLWRNEAWGIIEHLPQYNFLIPTKRLERVMDCLPTVNNVRYISGNVWLGASVENQEAAQKRVHILTDLPAAVRWLSIEPMLERIRLETSGAFYIGYDKKIIRSVDWVVYGGESGPNCRPCNPEWIRDGIKQCKAANVPVFVKQLGGWPDTRHELADFPEDLRVREFPR